MVIGKLDMSHEEFLVILSEKLRNIKEEVLSKVSIKEVKVFRKKGQEKEAKERVIKSLITLNDIEFNTVIDGYKVSKKEIYIYSDFDDCLELSCNTSKYSGDNKAFIDSVKEMVIDINNGDLNKDYIEDITSDILFKIQEKIEFGVNNN